MRTRRAKAYSSSCSQTVVYLQPFRRSSFLYCALQPKIAKINKKNPYFGSLEFIKVIDVNTTEKLVISACCSMQHAHVYLQRFSRKTDVFREKLVNNGKITTFTGGPLFDALVRKFP